jgi:hypothetical protein
MGLVFYFGLAVHIVAIAWLYVAILVACTEPSFVAGLASFFFYGLAPLLLFWYVVGTRARKRKKLLHIRMSDLADAPDQENPHHDQ